MIASGTAQEYWTVGGYHETDLDLCTPLVQEAIRALEEAGFSREGRHWRRKDVAVAVEFPDSRIDGDEGRTVLVRAGPGRARVIGVEDLYLDRLRQATATEDLEGDAFHMALAIAGARFAAIDWRYVRRRIREIEEDERSVGASMRRLHSKILRRVRREMTGPEEG
jgi:hypothetical protein